jgi:hypothetical protein
VKALLEAGADVRARGYEARCWAKQYGHTETVKVLEAAMAPAPESASAPPADPDALPLLSLPMPMGKAEFTAWVAGLTNEGVAPPARSAVVKLQAFTP